MRTVRRSLPRLRAVFRLGALPGLETILLVVAMGVVSLFGASNAAASVPSTFNDSLVASVPDPTGMAFLPDGRLLVASKDGFVYLVNGSRLTTVVDLSGVVCTDRERGLLGVAVDPAYASNRFIYVYYTSNKFGNDCPINDSSDPVNRVSRFTTSTSGLAGSEKVLIDGILSPGGYHNGGDLSFGKDGYLYVSVGDGICDLQIPTNCASANRNARVQNILNGKILRITSSGGIPAGNPFTGSDSGRCNVTGRTIKAKCQETYAWGFRNPFQFAMDPNAAGTRVYVNDVGQNTREEIDALAAGADYGWSLCEGRYNINTTTLCTAPGATAPIYDYGHTGGCGAITGGAFVPNGLWPSAYSGKYLFADYNCGKISILSGASATTFASSLGGLTTLKFGPSGATQALYYGTFNSGGQIRRILFDDPATRPAAAFTVSPRSGPLPLKVNFNASGSKAISGRTIASYTWNFGDGSSTKTGKTISHTFTTAKYRTVTLTVVDSKGQTSSVIHTVDAGNTPPTPSISSPSSAYLFGTGVKITLTGSASDTQDGAIPASGLRWSVDYLHGAVATSLLNWVAGNNIKVNIPQPADLATAASSTIRITLTATDSHGLHQAVSRTIKPKLIKLNFVTNPAGASLRIGELGFSGPATVQTWIHSSLRVEAIGGVSPSGLPLAFSSWSDGGAAVHQIAVPSGTTTYTANFSVVDGAAFSAGGDAYVRDSSPNSNFGTAATIVARSSGPRERAYLKFTVAGVNSHVSSAKLYLFATSTSTNSPMIYKTGTSWSEGALTWNNQPGAAGSALTGGGPVIANTWVAFDVTGAVTAGGTVSFVLQRDSKTTATFASRESGANAPRLVIVDALGVSTTVSPPQNLHGVATSSTSISLTWAAAASGDHVKGYDVERDGKRLATINPTQGYADNSVTASGDYFYRVRSRTTSGVSGWSTIEVRTPAPTQTSTILIKNSTFVSESSAIVDDLNPSTPLEVRDGDGATIETLFDFRVSTLTAPVYTAQLQVYVSPSNPGTPGSSIDVFGASSWVTGVMWRNRPDAHPVTGWDSATIPASGGWITMEIPAGSVHVGGVTMLLTTDSASVVKIERSGSHAPRLVITFTQSGASSSNVKPSPTATIAPPPAASPVAATETPIPSAPPSLPISDEFESGLGDWMVHGLATASDPVKDGTGSARSSGNGSPDAPDAPSYADRAIGEPRTELWISADIQTIQPPSITATLISALDPTGAPIAAIVLDRQSRLLLVDATGAAVDSAGAIPAAEWHRIELHINLGGAHPVLEAWLDGEPIGSLDLAPLANSVAAVRIGDSSGTSTFDVSYDNLAVTASCQGVCPDQPAPVADPTETAVPTLAPASTPTAAPTETPIPTETPVPPTGTPTPIPPVEAPPVASPAVEPVG